MPIDIDRFEDPDAGAEQPASQRIIRFLAANPEKAFTRQEIAEAIDANPATVGTNLTRLKKRGLVRHREPYWAFTDDRDAALETVRERYGDASIAELLERDDQEVVGGPETGTDDSGDTRQAVGSDTDADRTERDTARSIPDTGAITDSQHHDAAAAFFEGVRDRLGAAIDALYLFGSVSRGTATRDSDVDVLAVIADDAAYAAVDDQLLDIAYDVQLQHGVRIEVHSLSTDEFDARRDRGDPFIESIVTEGQSRG